MVNFHSYFGNFMRKIMSSESRQESFNIDICKREEDILKMEKNNTFEKSLESTKDCKPYTFYDGLHLQQDFLTMVIY